MVKKIEKGKSPLGKVKLTEKKKRLLIYLLAVLIILGLFYNFKQLFVAAMVNGRPITRSGLRRELEDQFGQQALETMVTKSLVFQEAKRQKIKVTDEEMEKELVEIEEELKSQGTSLDEFLKAQGQARKALEEQIKIQLVIEKLTSGGIEVTDEEVAEYFEENKDFFPEETTLEEAKEDLKERLRQTKMGEKFQEMVEELRQKAKIRYFLEF